MFQDIFQAIADLTRREIIDLLAGELLSVNDAAKQFEMSRPAVKVIKEFNASAVKVFNAWLDPKWVEYADRTREGWRNMLDKLYEVIDKTNFQDS